MVASMEAMNVTATSGASGPEEAAERTFAAHRHDPEWLDAFIAGLDHRRAVDVFVRTIETWGLTQAETARLFGVSRQAIGKWRRRGVPPERAEAVADLAAATDLLVRHLRRDRIPAVVRRPIPARGDTSLVALLGRGDTRAVLAACRDMFRFDRAQV